MSTQNPVRVPHVPVEKFPENEITNGTAIPWVADTKLAAALVAVGIPLRKDPPYTFKELPGGTRVVKWMFETQSTCGLWRTEDLIRAYKKQLDFNETHPTHPFTFAMDAVKNFAQMTEHILNDVPFVGFRARGGSATIFVKKGSKNHMKCLQRGYKPI